MSTQPLTELDWKILEQLQQDGRISVSELASQLNRSRSNISEHLEGLQSLGILQNFTINTNLEQLGFGISAFVKLSASSKEHRKIIAEIDEMPEVAECHVMTGNQLLVMRIVAKDMPHLRGIVDGFTQYGSTQTDVIFATTKSNIVINDDLKKSLS